MAEAQSPSGFAIRELSKYRSHLLYAQRKQLDAGCWEPVAAWLLRRARVCDIGAAVIALLLLGYLLLAAQSGRVDFGILAGFAFYGALLVLCAQEAVRIRTAVRIVREETGAPGDP
jgi:hypothetical protein